MSVLPGLADMHVHLMILGHGDYEHWDAAYRSQFRDVIMPAAAKQLLESGVTVARDLGAELQDSLTVRDRINKGEIPGPRLFVSGPFIQHAPYTEREKEYRWGVNGPADARAKVQKIVDAGVDVVKLIDQDQMTEEEVKAVVDTAHKGATRRGARAPRDEIRIGLKYGVDC
jgi:imidazolonepropionase-like amidohydrolase